MVGMFCISSSALSASTTQSATVSTATVSEQSVLRHITCFSQCEIVKLEFGMSCYLCWGVLAVSFSLLAGLDIFLDRNKF